MLNNSELKLAKNNLKKAMKGFDFKKTEIAMKVLDWKWGFIPMRVPDKEDMKETIEELFEFCINSLKENPDKDEQGFSSGGFTVDLCRETMDVEIYFTLEASYSGEME